MKSSRYIFQTIIAVDAILSYRWRCLLNLTLKFVLRNGCQNLFQLKIFSRRKAYQKDGYNEPKQLKTVVVEICSTRYIFFFYFKTWVEITLVTAQFGASLVTSNQQKGNETPYINFVINVGNRDRISSGWTYTLSPIASHFFNTSNNSFNLAL